jgi:polysaccharide export outer membrane protein
MPKLKNFLDVQMNLTRQSFFTVYLISLLFLISACGEIESDSRLISSIPNEGNSDTKSPSKKIHPVPTRENSKIDRASKTNSIVDTEINIKKAQVLLSELGFNPGPIDGIFGAKTRKAVSSFQRISGKKVDGQITPNLIGELEQALKDRPTTKRKFPKKSVSSAQEEVQARNQKEKWNSPTKRQRPFRSFVNRSSKSLGDYRVGGKDVLKITVYEEPELSSDETRVSNDGFITFPLIGRIRVEGMTTGQIERDITRRLKKDYLVNPQVSVHLKEFASKVVNVLGAVRDRGAIPLQSASTLLEVLGRAGGVNIEEAGQTLTILRPLPGKRGVKNITVDLDRLLKKGDMTQNIVLQNQDTVFVPQADQIFVFGEVSRPGPYKLQAQNISVVEAITMAGGPTRLAAPNRTRVVRVENGKEQTISINVDDIVKGDKKGDLKLRSGDIIVIPQAYF